MIVVALHPRQSESTQRREAPDSERGLRSLFWFGRHAFRGGGLFLLQLPLFCLELADPAFRLQLGDLPVSFPLEIIAVQRTPRCLASTTP